MFVFHKGIIYMFNMQIHHKRVIHTHYRAMLHYCKRDGLLLAAHTKHSGLPFMQITD